MAKSYRCLICGRLTLKPAVTLPHGVIGPVCAAKVAPRLPLGRAKKTAQTAGKRLRRGVSDDHTADMFCDAALATERTQSERTLPLGKVGKSQEGVQVSLCLAG